MHRYYVFDILFVLLGIALLIAIFKYPKDALIRLPLGFLYIFFRNLFPFVAISSRVTGDDKPDTSYPHTSRLKVNFSAGDKYALLLSTKRDPHIMINDFLEALTGKHSIEEFTIRPNGAKKIISFPRSINFYDFFLLVGHLKWQ